MGYVLDSFNPASRQVLLKDDWNGSDYKILIVNDWTGYESDIEVKVDEGTATLSLSNGSVKRFDLTVTGNMGVEI